jgi:hypothetical protein
MKKIFSSVAIFLSSFLHSLPVTNPASPALLKEGLIWGSKCDCYGLKMDYIGDFVNNRYVKDLNGKVSRFSYYSHSGVIIFNAFDLLDVYGWAGVYNYKYNNNQPDTLGVNYLVQASSKNQLVWGLGVKAILWKKNFGACGATYIGIDSKYQVAQPTLFNAAYYNGNNALTDNTNYHTREAQVALGVAHKIGLLVPYAALKWSYFKAKENRGAFIEGMSGSPIISIYHLKSYTHFGFAAGLTLLVKERLSVGVEYAFNDESSFSINSEVRF